MASTVIYSVNPSGITIGADGKYALLGGAPNSRPLWPRTATKIVLIGGRFALANVNLAAIQLRNGKILYDFPSWAKAIDRKLGFRTTIDDAANLVRDEAMKTFQFMDRNPTVPDTLEPGEGGFVGYLIAGYDSGTAKIFKVTLEFDRASKRLVSHKDLEHPKPGEVPPYEGGMGGHSASDALAKRDGKTRREFVAMLPDEVRAMSKHRDWTVDQARHVVKVLIQLEAEATPENVAFPITVITIPAKGMPSTKVYEKP